MKNILKLFRPRTYIIFIILVLISIVSIVPTYAAINVNDGIYFSNANKNNPNYYPTGYSEHVFNKYLDSLEKCRAFMKLKDNETYFIRQMLQYTEISRNELEKLESIDECVGSLYTDERKFIGVNKLYGAKTNSINPIMQEVYYKFGLRQMYYDLNFSLPATIGDIFQTKIFIHDNAGTNPANYIKNTQVVVSIENNTIKARVGNETIYSVAASTINISDDQELTFAQPSDYPAGIKLGNYLLSEMSNYLIEAKAATDPKTLKTFIESRDYRDLRAGEYSFSADRKSFTYTKGDQMGSFPYSYSLVLDLVVKKKAPTTSCVDRINGVPGAGPRQNTDKCTPGQKISFNGQTLTCTDSCQFPGDYNICVDRFLGVPGAGAKLPTDECLPGQTRTANGQTVTCNASCQFPTVPTTEFCSDRVRAGRPGVGEVCIAGSLSSDGKMKCNNSCTAFDIPVAETCRDIYYKDQARFKSLGYECVTADGKPSASCSGDQPTGGVGACKIIKDPNLLCSACGCIEMNVESVAGNYQRINYVVEVSNQTTNTLAANIEVRSRKADDSVGYKKTKYLDNIRNGGTINRDLATNEGEVRLTDDALQVINSVKITKTSPLRASDPKYKNIPMPSVDADSVVKFLQNPKDNYILVNNLVPGARAGTIDTPSDGDEITLTIPATVRTDQNGTDKFGNNYTALQGSTQFVDYLFFLKTQTNGAMDNVAISKPYFVTYNAGDVVTSLAITGIANAGKLANVFNSATNISSINEVSGFLFDAGSTEQIFSSSKDFQGITYSTGFKQELKDNIAKTTNDGMSTQGSLFSGGNVNLNNESVISNTNFNQRLDGERIFTLENGDITVYGNNTVSINGVSQSTLSLGNRSTIIIKNGDLIINSNITYAENTNGVVPAVAFILQNGSVKIDPRVSRIDGVYVADKFTGTDNWKTVYETQKLNPIQLLVNGSLLGSINDLILSRPFAADPLSTKGGAAINVNYDGRMIATPPPGLREILGGTFEKLKQ